MPASSAPFQAAARSFFSLCTKNTSHSTAIDARFVKTHACSLSKYRSKKILRLRHRRRRSSSLPGQRPTSLLASPPPLLTPAAAPAAATVTAASTSSAAASCWPARRRRTRRPPERRWRFVFSFQFPTSDLAAFFSTSSALFSLSVLRKTTGTNRARVLAWVPGRLCSLELVFLCSRQRERNEKRKELAEERFNLSLKKKTLKNNKKHFDSSTPTPSPRARRPRPTASAPPSGSWSSARARRPAAGAATNTARRPG